MIKILQILVVNLPLVGGQNIYSEAAQLEAKQRLALLAENDVVLGTASTASALTELRLKANQLTSVQAKTS